MLQCIHPAADIQPACGLSRWDGQPQWCAVVRPVEVRSVTTLDCVVVGQWDPDRELMRFVLVSYLEKNLEVVNLSIQLYGICLIPRD
eukprot:SAG31_NODE_34815_length_329_cov_0.560870_1_plen_86_part_01